MNILIINAELIAMDAGKGADRGDVVIVVDVLRCTSTIVTALANGASDVIAVKSVSEALSLKSKKTESILAGERGGLPPKGFEFGNSPRDFLAKNINGRSIIITTSSGTQTINNVLKAKAVLLGSFLNLTAVANEGLDIANEESCGLTVAMSGKLGSFSLEDFLCSGAIMELWEKKSSEFSDSAYSSLLAYKSAKGNLLQHILKGNHAKELIDIGFLDDLIFCCEQDKYDTVPILKEKRIICLKRD